MKYDTIDGGYEVDYEHIKFFTIGQLIEVCKKHPNNIVHFLGTYQSPGKLCSWRGSYDIPAITTAYGDKTGNVIAEELTAALRESHCGWKGGEYHYHDGQEFYIAESGSSAEYKVVKAELEDGILILYTKLDPY